MEYRNIEHEERRSCKYLGMSGARTHGTQWLSRRQLVHKNLELMKEA